MDNNFKELLQKYTEAKNFGLKLQKEGIKIVTAANTGLEVLAYLESKQVLNKPEIATWIAQANATMPNTIPDLREIDIFSSTVMLTSGTSLVTASSSVKTTTSLSTVALNKSDFVIPPNAYNPEELDGYLNDFVKKFPDVGDLVRIRKGAWDNFYSGIDSNLLFASHGMREILSKIIAKWATNEEVKKAEWWTVSDGTASGITLRQRLRYLIFGPFQGEDDTLNLIDASVKTAFDADEKLKQLAHGSEKLKNEVKEALQITEITLLSIFQARNLRKISLVIHGHRQREDVDGYTDIPYYESLTSGEEISLIDCSIENIFIGGKCTCGHINILEAKDFDKQCVEENRGMGAESQLWTTAYASCAQCKLDLVVDFMLNEYPKGIYSLEKEWLHNMENCECWNIRNLEKLVEKRAKSNQAQHG